MRIFLLCVMGMSHMMSFAVNIRMYSWGMFFLIMSFLAACDAVCRQTDFRSMSVLTIFGLAACYTHYFCGIAMIYLYLALLLYMLLWNRRGIVWLAGSGIALTVGYLPWLPILYRQLCTVREGYWIEPVTLRSLVSFLQYIFNPSVYAYHSGTLLGLLLLALTIAVALFSLYLLLWRRAGEGQREICFCAVTGIGMVPFIILLGVVLSALVKPILVQRYLFLGFGVLWTGFAVGVSLCRSRRLQMGITAFVLLMALLNCNAFFRTEEEGRAGWRKLTSVLSEVREEDALLVNFGQVRLALAYAMPDTQVCYYWRQQTEKLFMDLYGNLSDTRDEEEILAHLQENGRLYYFDTLELPEFHFQEDYTDQGLSFCKLDQILIEDTLVQVYEIERSEAYAEKRSD